MYSRAEVRFTTRNYYGLARSTSKSKFVYCEEDIALRDSSGYLPYCMKFQHLMVIVTNFICVIDLLLCGIQFNFVGRLLGPRGNSLKRVEASTGCRVYIRGKGSIKDPGKVLNFCLYFLFNSGV